MRELSIEELSGFYLEVYDRCHKGLAELNIDRERYTWYCNAVRLYMRVEHSIQTTYVQKAEVDTLHDLIKAFEFYVEHSDDGTIILKGLWEDRSVITGLSHDVEVIINLYAFIEAIKIASHDAFKHLEFMQKGIY